MMLAPNQGPEHSAAEIDFGLPLGPVAEWSSFEREIATCAAIAYLVEPHNEIRRAGIRAEMLGNYFLRLERRQASSKSKKRRLRIEMLRESFLEPQWRLLIPRAAPSGHVAAISFDLNNPEKKARSDKTSGACQNRPVSKTLRPREPGPNPCGTIVRAMDFAHRHGDGALLTLDEAKTTSVPTGGEFRLWRTELGARSSKRCVDGKAAVGHLAAALLSFAEAECRMTKEIDPGSSASRVGTQMMPKFGIPNRHQLQRQIVRFLGNAQYYRELLVKIRSGRETSRYPMDFFAFPSWLELAAQAPDAAICFPRGWFGRFRKLARPRALPASVSLRKKMQACQ